MTPNVKIVGEAEVIQKLNAMPDEVRKRVAMSVTRLAIEMVGYVKGSKLSGQVLKNRTGTLRRSVTHRVISDATGVRAVVGTNVKYARVHEYGFSGTENVREHMRKAARVRAHTRNVNKPERSFLRSSLSDKASHIRSEIKRAVGDVTRGGKR